MKNNTELIRTRLEANGIPFRQETPEKLGIYMDLLEEWNQRMDLTAVTEPEETADKHFIDSLTVLKTPLLEHVSTLIDVGTGAGFPGLVIAIACPEIAVTLMDSQQKRLDFLSAVCRATGTDHTILVHARAEDGGRNRLYREQFDAATARAVAPMNTLCEYLLPFVRVQGRALCWKGPALKNELDDGRKAAHLLGGRLEMPYSCPVDGRDWEHRILPVLKVQRTPSAYPRRAGMPKNSPLGQKLDAGSGRMI